MATAKTRVQSAHGRAICDYSEHMRNTGQPCYFIRIGLQGAFLHEGLFRSQKAAWKAADRAMRCTNILCFDDACTGSCSAPTLRKVAA
jgi:hypothetical protein